MSAKNPLIVIGLGEVLWDCFPDERRPGGAPANVAFHARQLGLQGIVCSRVGRDEPGDELVRILAERGVTTDHIQQDPQRPTGTVSVRLDEADDPTYEITRDVAWDALAYTPDWQRLFEQCAAVCFGTLAQREVPSRDTIHRALEAAAGALRVVDVNLRDPWYSAAVLTGSLAQADVVKLNRDEVAEISKVLGLPARNPDEFAEILFDRHDVRIVCVTLGKEGAVLYAPGQRAVAGTEPVRTVDAVGAGDAFTAGLTYALLHEWPLAAAGAFANRVGALVATRAGAMPVLADEFRQLRDEFV
jgi:fructokinase